VSLRRPLILAPAAALAAAATLCVQPTITSDAARSLYFEVSDVAHGRVALVDTAAGGGWGALDALGAVFALGPAATPGRVLFAASVLGAIAAALVVWLASGLAPRSTRRALLGAAAGVTVLTLAAPLPDALAPASGALTLVVPVLALAVCARPRPRAALLLLVLGAWWSPPAALLTCVAVALSSREWPAAARRHLAGRAHVAVALGLTAFAASALIRTGSLPDAGAVLSAIVPHRGAPDPGPSLLAVLVAGAGIGAALVAGAGIGAASVRGAGLTTSPHRAEPVTHAAIAVAALIATWAVLAGSAIALAWATALALVVLGSRAQRARQVLGVLALTVLAVLPPGHVEQRWKATALYDAMPHRLLEHVGFGPHVGRSLRYDVEVLTDRPRLTDANPFVRAVRSAHGRLRFLADPEASAKVFAATDSATAIPLGDPLRDDTPAFLRDRGDRAIDDLPDGARVLTRLDWYLIARFAAPAQYPPGPAFRALRRMIATRRVVPLDTGNGAVLLSLRPRIARSGRGDSKVIEAALRRDLQVDLLDRLRSHSALEDQAATTLALEAQRAARRDARH